MVLHERSLPRTFPFCPTLPPRLGALYMRIAGSAITPRLILYALANSSWILMTTLYRSLAADQALNLLFQRNSVLSCTHGCYAYVLSSTDLALRIRSLPRYVSIECCGEMGFRNKTMFARGNYADSQDSQILIRCFRRQTIVGGEK